MCSVIWPGASAECHVEVLTPSDFRSLRPIFMASGFGFKNQTSGIDRSSKRDPSHCRGWRRRRLQNAGDVLKLMGKIRNRDLLMARSLRGEHASSQGWLETGAKALLARMIWVIMSGDKASMSVAFPAQL